MNLENAVKDNIEFFSETRVLWKKYWNEQKNS